MIGLDFLLAEHGCSDGLVEPFLGASSANVQKCFGTEDKQDHNNISNGDVARIIRDIFAF